MAKRPVLEWIILTYLAYNIVATLPSMLSGPPAGIPAPIVYFALAVVSWAVSVFLFTAIWGQTSKRVFLAWISVAVVALSYVYAFSVIEPQATDELSLRKEYTIMVVFAAVMLALQSLIPLDYMRIQKRSP